MTVLYFVRYSRAKIISNLPDTQRRGYLVNGLAADSFRRKILIHEVYNLVI